jgi:hypothetical protein
LYRYGQNGAIYWCRKRNGKNVWKNLQTTDRKQAMALVSLYNFAASQNENHDVTIVTGGSQSQALLSLTDHVPQPVAAVSIQPTERLATHDITEATGLSLNALVERFHTESKHLAESTRNTRK